MDFPAHIRLEVMGRTVQTVETHCRHCAAYAAAAAPRGMGQTAFLAGLLHDCGKYTAVFKDYITRAAAGEPVRRGSVNHTFAGVRLAMERWHHGADPFRRLTCEIIAFAVGSHHGQFDCIAPDGTDTFTALPTGVSITARRKKIFCSTAPVMRSWTSSSSRRPVR